jgi:hypothetical protein
MWSGIGDGVEMLGPIDTPPAGPSAPWVLTEMAGSVAGHDGPAQAQECHASIASRCAGLVQA